MPPLTAVDDATLAIVPPRLLPTSAPMVFPVPMPVVETEPPTRRRSRTVPELIPIRPTPIWSAVLAIARLAIACPSPVSVPVKAGLV
ncbi:hypothetical protein CHKEEEPN_0526 [Methylorubrum podarium]|nr:hypothetical protein CHKEEEPN_0526 [Methylorubrum podarium]